MAVLLNPQIHFRVHSGQQRQRRVGDADLGIHGSCGGLQLACKAGDPPGKVLPMEVTLHIHRLTHTNADAADSGTGKISRSRLFCESRTMGMACVCDAVPA